MRKILAVGITILAGIGGCKSLDCGCPMAVEKNQESIIRSQSKQTTLLTPDTCSPTAINSIESRPHFYQKTCTD